MRRGLAEDLALLAQIPILPAQAAQLVALDAGEAMATATWVQIGLANPLTNSGLGQVQLPGDLADRLAAAADQLDDFSLVLRREEPSGAWHRTPISRAEPSSWVSTRTGQLHPAPVADSPRTAPTTSTADFTHQCAGDATTH